MLLELQPAFTSQPSSSSSVLEGDNLILQWNYSLGGKSIFVARFRNVTNGDVPVVIRREANNATVQAGFEHLFSAAISDTQATLTILAVPRSYDGDKYLFSILFDDLSNMPNPVTVEISVFRKYTMNVQSGYSWCSQSIKISIGMNR